MTTTRRSVYNLADARAVHLFVFLVLLLMILLHSQNARAVGLVPDEVRIGRAVAKFDDAEQFATVFKFHSPRRLRARYLELALAAITTSNESRPFVSLGPVWRFPVFGDRVSMQLGFSPTLLAGSTCGDRFMGGNVHFTSSVGVQAAFGLRRDFTIALHMQHTSNGGLNSTNSGMDIAGLSFGYRFDD